MVQALVRLLLTAQTRFLTVAIHVGFVVEKVTMAQVFLPALQFSPVSSIPPMLHTHLDLHVARGESWNLKKSMLFSETWEH